MSGGLYEVGVHLIAVDGISGVLAAISKSVLGLHGSVKELEHGFRGLKMVAVGAAMGVAGEMIGHATVKVIEHGAEIVHWQAQLAAAGFASVDVAKATAAAWANAGTNMNTTATEGLKNIVELNKATGSLNESIRLLPAFSIAQTAMQSVKAEDLHSRFNAGGQTLNFARGLEEMGVTQRGKTEEQRRSDIELYTRELTKTMISSRGLFDGNALYAMTNNSGGAAQNWDFRMGTVVAPIIADIMRAGKLGNADYMAVRGLQGGHVDSQTVKHLWDAGLLKNTDVTGAGDKMKLQPNNSFATGISENLWDWSGRLLEQLKSKGYNVEDQKQMNELVNQFGSNKSLASTLRAVLEPASRAQIQKEMNLRDQVPDNAAGTLQKKDPFLALDALKKKWDDFLTALGSPLVEPAIKVLDVITHGINSMAQALAAHPDVARDIGIAALGISAALMTLGGAAVIAGAAALAPGAAVAVGIAAIVGLVGTLSAIHWDAIKDLGKNLAADIVFGIGSVAKVFAEEINKLPGQVAGAIAGAIGAIGGMLAGALAHLNPFGGGGSPAVAGTSPGVHHGMPGAPEAHGGRQAAPSPSSAGGRYHGASWEQGIGQPRQQTASLTVPVTVNADGQKLATVVTRHQVAMAKYPTSIGPADSRGSYQGPGANDWAWS